MTNFDLFFVRYNAFLRKIVVHFPVTFSTIQNLPPRLDEAQV